MPLIEEKDREKLIEQFEDRLRGDVTLVLFKQEHKCLYCSETRQFLEELEGLSDKLHLEIYDLVEDKAEQFGIDKVPAIALVGEKDYGVRFYGIPVGYEFAAIIDDIMDISWGFVDLPPEAMEVAMTIEEPVHIQVFVSPTCPYCPQAVRAAHKFAILNDNVVADMVETTEFPEVAKRYDVLGVPKIVINETFSIEGAYPDKAFAQFVKHAVEGQGHQS